MTLIAVHPLCKYFFPWTCKDIQGIPLQVCTCKICTVRFYKNEKKSDNPTYRTTHGKKHPLYGILSIK